MHAQFEEALADSACSEKGRPMLTHDKLICQSAAGNVLAPDVLSNLC